MNAKKKILTILLNAPVKIILFRKKPEIIAITGSAGKTSCKEFLGILLSGDFDVLIPLEGYNTEIGAPLAIFGERVPDSLGSIRSWARLLFRLYKKAIFMTDFPEKVIVEMGADNPGDIKYLAKLFKPKVGVVLEVLPVHVEQFKDLSAVAKEKAELVSAVPVSGRVYLNYDNPDVRKMADRSKAPIFYFGTSGDCLGYCAKDIKTDISGMNFSLLSEGKKYSFTASLYGKHMIYPLLAAIAVANGEGISISDLAMKTKKLKPYKGRMNIIAGINGSIIIDDTYNANPASTMEALDFLYNQKGRHIAILGNMNELGEYEKVGHRMVGEKAASCVDYLFTVGEVAKSVLAPAAIAAGMNSGHIKSFDTAREAGQYVSKILKEDDVVLAKGSQNKVRMEKAVEFLMAKPSEKKNLLVRQSDFWKEN